MKTGSVRAYRQPPRSEEGRKLVHELSNAIGATRLHLLACRVANTESERAVSVAAAESAMAAGAHALEQMRRFVERLEGGEGSDP